MNLETELTHSEQAIVCDITYLKTDAGHAYLATATDPYSKKIMGYAVDNNMKVNLENNSLENAVAERINETLKYEYGLKRQIINLHILKKFYFCTRQMKRKWALVATNPQGIV
jgi:hypothetical protein